MSESKRMSQWFVWVMIGWLLTLTSSLYCASLIGQAMLITNPLADLYGWRMVVAGIGSVVTVGWWLTRGRYYERKKGEAK